MLWRVQGSGPPTNPTEIYTYFNGLQTSDVGNDGPAQTDYATAINARTAAAQASSPFKAGHAVPYANTDEGYDPLNPTAGGEAATGEIYVTRDGDTLRTIALLFWGDESLWYILADANGLTGTEALAAGQRIIVPSKVVNVHNKNSTFRVYDPNQALGDIQPNQPKPPKPPKQKHGCGTIGKILVAVVAVAVAVVTAGAAVAALSTSIQGLSAGIGAVTGGALGTAGASASLGTLVAAGTIGGAAGSIVSQGVAIAIGVQDSFSWKGVAIAAIAGGVGGGLGKFSPFGKGQAIANGVARQATANAITQGVSVAAGLQHKFDWTGVAIGAVVGGVSAAGAAAAGNWARVIPGSGALPGLARAAVTGAAGAMAGAAARSLLTGTDFGDNLMAVLPDAIASTVGNMIAGGIQQRSAQAAQDRATAARHANGDYLTESLQGAAAQYAADHPVGLGQDVWNSLADTQASIDALFSPTMGNGGGGTSLSPASLQDALVTSEAIRSGAGSPVTGVAGQGRPSTLGGLSLTKDAYLSAVKDGLWGQVQGNPNAATGFSNNSQVNAAAAKVQALPSVSGGDLQGPSDLSAFVQGIGPATANARIGGRDQNYEKFLTFGRDSDGQVIVTGISLVGPQGGNISGLLTPDVISVAHVHYQGLNQPPNSGDNSILKFRNLPSYVIGDTGRNVWEIGRVSDTISIRSVGPNNTFGAWEKYQSNANNYRIYNGNKYP